MLIFRFVGGVERKDLPDAGDGARSVARGEQFLADPIVLDNSIVGSTLIAIGLRQQLPEVQVGRVIPDQLFQ